MIWILRPQYHSLLFLLRFPKRLSSQWPSEHSDILLSLSSFAAYISGNSTQRGLLRYLLSRHLVYFCHTLITTSNHITEVICVNVYFISGCGWQRHKALVTKMFSAFPDQNTKKKSKQAKH